MLCADDFAQNHEISCGILRLCEAGRLSAVSIMTQSPLLAEYVPALQSLTPMPQLGVHLNLTHAFQNTLTFKLGSLLWRSHLHVLPKHRIKASIVEQLDLFEKHFQCPPSFIDGHQHIHVLPVIRNILFEELTRRNWQSVWLRNCCQTNPRTKKTIIINLMGAKRFKKLCKKHQVFCHKTFSGIYDFNRINSNYANSFEKFLAFADLDQLLIMCHPGLPSSDIGDPIAKARSKEFQFLKSQAFLEMLQQHQLHLL